MWNCSEDASGAVVLAGAESLTLPVAARLRDELLALARAERVELDLTRITEADLAGIQVVLAAQREWSARGGKLAVIAGPSGAWARTLAAAGLEREIGSADRRPGGRGAPEE